MTKKHDDAPDAGRRRLLGGMATTGALLALGGVNDAAAAASKAVAPAPRGAELDALLEKHIDHVVVIYAENRSFNNLFGDFPGVKEPMSSLPPERTRQIDRNGKPFDTLPPIWGGMVPHEQSVAHRTYKVAEKDLTGLPNAPWALRMPDGTPLPHGVITRDLVHAFYNNQAQINGGKNDGFVAWGNTGGMVMGYYGETEKNLGLWQVARQYTLCDNFFMAAFGGSYLNHQFLISGRCPVYPNAANSPAKRKIAVLSDGPTGHTLALDPKSPKSALEGRPHYANDGAITPDGFAVNTMAPPYQPSFVRPAPGGDPLHANPEDPAYLPPQTYDTIGDLLSRKGVSWTWYGGAFQAALDHKGGGSKPNFQYHHQPFNYFKSFAPGTAERAAHIRDGGLGDSPISNKFLADVVAGKLPAVSFYKPQGNLNLHAGYSDIESGDQHIVNVLEHLKKSPQWENMVVVVTFDENGGWWDHVAPPKGDRWGPGSRIPAIIVSPFAKKSTVDHSFYDTTSILRFITRLHGLPLLEGLAERNKAFAERGALPPGDLTGALAFR